MMTTSLANVAVIGSGTMGAGIAEVAAAAGHTVRIFDINPCLLYTSPSPR
ncbi:3-hydroxyacyl-CoA dehydrogenase NAD-binding domain-containing protein, partial [Klebsiella quasipneumoniae subsp. similipneumoniae]